MKTLLTLKDISSNALPISTLRTLAREDNNFPAFKVGRKWVIFEGDYTEWLDKQKGDSHISLSIKTIPPQIKEEVSL